MFDWKLKKMSILEGKNTLIMDIKQYEEVILASSLSKMIPSTT